MDTQLSKLLVYINARLETNGLTLSDYGKAEVLKRWKLPETQGGYSNYWKELNEIN